MTKRDRFSDVHLPCPCGKSSDAYCVRQDGSGFCFSCSENFNAEDEKTDEVTMQDIRYEVMGHRSIQKKVYDFYGVETKIVDNEPVEVAFPYGSNSLKIRDLKIKNNMKTIGEFTKAGLFGQDKFDRGSKEGIVITEGEFDAMAAYDMLRGRFACVSIKSGAQSAVKDLSRRDIWDYVNSFDKIYICFDNDDPGRTAVQGLQGIFDFRKTYHVQLSRHKDANDYTVHREHDDFEQAVLKSKRFAPDNIISSFSDIERALEEAQEEMIAEYPFPELQDKTFGLHEGEVIVVKAPEGVGKTEFFRALEHHVLKTTNHPIALFHLEELNSTTIKAISGYELHKPATLPENISGLSKKDVLEGYRKAVENNEERIHIHSSFDVEDEDAFYGSMRFVVGAAGCKLVFFDHITWLATGQNEDEDERKKLDRISQRLKLMAKELKFCLVMVSHVNDDGKTRGSRNISKVANTVLSLNRDLLSGSNEITFMLEKVRLGGRTGPAGSSFFYEDTGRLEAFEREPVLEDE